MDIHASMGKKGVGRVSEVEETRIISSRTGRLTDKKNEHFEHEELAFIPPQVPSNESAGTQTPQEPDENLVEGESGGEAPETITAVDGLNESRSFASKAARAVERQKQAATQRRKERDLRLKLQARLRKKRVMNVDLPIETIENAPTGEKINDRHGLQNLVPALLPDSILLVEPANPVLNSNPIPMKSHSTRHRLLGLTAIPPKDLKHGSKTVRVLESNRVLLPPRSALRGKTLRESWLSGRRGRDPNGTVPRRNMGNGFVRRAGL